MQKKKQIYIYLFSLLKIIVLRLIKLLRVRFACIRPILMSGSGVAAIGECVCVCVVVLFFERSFFKSSLGGKVRSNCDPTDVYTSDAGVVRIF